jgi:hypothetical protein
MYFSEQIDNGTLTVTCLISNRSWVAPAANVVAKKETREQAASWQKSLLSKIEVPSGYHTLADLSAAVAKANLI